MSAAYSVRIRILIYYMIKQSLPACNEWQYTIPKETEKKHHQKENVIDNITEFLSKPVNDNKYTWRHCILKT